MTNFATAVAVAAAATATATVERCAQMQSRDGGGLQLDDTLLLPEELSAENLAERFHLAWEALVDRGQPSLALVFRALFFR